jgi:hypothetical protein
MTQCLAELIGPFGEPETYTPIVDISKATIRRMASLHDAFVFMLGVYGCQSGKLAELSVCVQQMFVRQIRAGHLAQHSLAQYVQVLIEVLCTQCQLSSDDAQKQLNRAEQYYLLTSLRSTVATLSKHGAYYLLQYDKPVSAFVPDTVKELSEIQQYAQSHANEIPLRNMQKRFPEWFFKLEIFEQRFLLEALKSIENLQEVSVSSRLRTLPALANAAVHSMWVLDVEGNVREQCLNRYRGAHLASRDISGWDSKIQTMYIERNLAAIPRTVDSGALFITTLISPQSEMIAKATSNILPDGMLHKGLSSVIKQSQIDYVNLPINYFGAFLPWSNHLTTLLDKYETEDSQHLLAIQPLLDEARRLLNKQDAGGSTWNAVNLRLAAIFHLMASLTGTSFGSCVSGKDRYALLLAYVDTMVLFKSIYGFWPGFQSAQKKLFNQLLMNVLATNHQAVLANLNAPGAMGLKNLKDYLCAILTKKNMPWADMQHKLASTNELRDICKACENKRGFGMHLFLSVHIGPGLCRELNEKIYALVQEALYWQDKAYGAELPRGIDKIRQIISSEPKKKHIFAQPKMSPELVFANILAVVTEALGRQSTYRNEDTIFFYKLLEPLIEKKLWQDPTDTVMEVIKKLTLFHHDIKQKIQFTEENAMGLTP